MIQDLKGRGLLDSTLVVWGGEFGRTPVSGVRNTMEEGNAGRDHHPAAYSMWLAGGGTRGGQVIGKTDELGFFIEEDKVHMERVHFDAFSAPSAPFVRLHYDPARSTLALRGSRSENALLGRPLGLSRPKSVLVRPR
ncbi:MAG: DUF1501 domain-containing protein [Terriglobia bacterium]